MSVIRINNEAFFREAITFSAVSYSTLVSGQHLTIIYSITLFKLQPLHRIWLTCQ